MAKSYVFGTQNIMKRIIPIILALCFSLNSVVSPFVYAKKAQPEATTEAALSNPAVSERSENESSATNPIGDNSSYYNVKGLHNAPKITAESATLIDASTGAILYQKAAGKKRYPASITKVMTALLTIENCSMDDTVTFSSQAVNGIEVGSSSAGIPVGAQLTVEETLYAMMLVSANEAAAALAEQVSGSEKEFGKLMTARAKELGCKNTHFTNPHGLPDENHYTTAADMALIVKQAMKYEEFRKIAGTESYTLKSRKTMSDTLELWNHAKILRESTDYYYKYAEGAKTGFTQAAWNTLVSYAKKGDVELICIILRDNGAPNSYQDTKALYEWGFKKVKALKALSNFDLNAAISSYPNLDKEKVEAIKSLNCTFNKDYYTVVRANFDESNVSTAFTLQEDKNTGILGYIEIKNRDQVIGKTPVTYDITSDSAVKYMSGKKPAATTAIKTTIKNSSKTEIIVSVVSVIVIILIVGIFIRSIVKKIKKKKDKKKSAKDIRKELQENPPTKRRHRK